MPNIHIIDDNVNKILIQECYVNNSDVYDFVCFLSFSHYGNDVMTFSRVSMSTINVT